MAVHRLVVGTSVVIALCCAAAWPARADLTPRVTGPATVVPGRVVSFQARGFRPGSLLEVVLTPADRPSCCAARIPASFSVSSVGSVSLTFKMPLVYRRCLSSAGQCHKVRWRPRQRVAVTAYGYLQEATARTSVAS